MVEMIPHFLQKFSFLSFLSVVALLASFVTADINYYRAANAQNVANENPTLTLCATPDSVDNILTRKAISIPTLNTNQFTYTMKEFQVESTPLTECPNGQTPIPVQHGIVTLSAFDKQKVQELDLTKFLRKNHFIMDSGILSFANKEVQAIQYFKGNGFCVAGLSENDNGITAQLKICPLSNQNRTMLQKCCPMEMYYSTVLNNCIPQNTSMKWEPVFMDVTTSEFLPMNVVDPVITSPLFDCKDNETEYWEEENCDLKFHPTTNNTVAFIGAYRTWEFLNANKWCIDGTRDTKNGQNRMVLLYCTQTNNTPKDKISISFIYMIAIYTGAFFSLLTTLVYLITWSKQRVFGKIICSVTASLFFQHIFTGTVHLMGLLQTIQGSFICYWNSVGAQFSSIAAFTWLALFNFDLWSTLGSMTTSKIANRFRVYTCVGWLLPLLVTGISLVLDSIFVCRTSGVLAPEFGAYYCFIAPWAQGLYLYYHLGILIAISCSFSVMTLLSLIQKRNAGRQSIRHKIRFRTILKLTVVMGIGWCFEVISWALDNETNHIVWIILDLYNSLSSMLIFYIFVCNKPTWILLKNAIPWLQGNAPPAETKLNSSLSGPTMPLDSMPFTPS